MSTREEVVVTGLGVVSPIGIGVDAFQESLRAERSGVRRLTQLDPSLLPVQFGGEVIDFEPKKYVRPRKSLKVMSRDIQIAFSAADQALIQAGVSAGTIDGERFGVMFGSDLIQPDPEEVFLAYRACQTEGGFDFARWGEASQRDIYPLWMLKHLPNMPACHIGIAFDARGPNNTVTLGEVSSHAAMAEGARLIERGWADIVLTGGTGTRVHPTWIVRNSVAESSRRNDAPERAARPFEAARDGEVFGEGAAAAVLEGRTAAKRRGAKILARAAGFGNAFGRAPDGGVTQTAIEQSIIGALRDAGLRAEEVGVVAAFGRSTRTADEIEARAIHAVLGDVPVTVPKSFYGNLGSGGGAVDLVAAVTMLQARQIVPTLNHETPDPKCPVKVVSRRTPLSKPVVLMLSQTPMGQAAAVCLVGEG
ncbi:MAG: beta-ketoacyl-[acyl-carrier-protein] synthase family protein [Pirellula sp.]|nr:beta-ketoacyl-[acyl-carrier-protein] synthase family protein [Pirellula sp.]